MGKVIILAGAPAAASLDFSAMPSRPGIETLPIWKGRGECGINDSDNASTFDHPQWRVVSRAVEDRESQIPPQESWTAEGLEVSQPPTVDSSRHLYGDTEFATLTQASTAVLTTMQQTTFDAGRWQVGSFGTSTLSFDQASMSFCLPNALPDAAPGMQQPRPASLAATTSQALLEHSLAVHDALPSSMPHMDLPSLQVNGVVEETTLSFSQSESFSFTSTILPLPTAMPQWQPLTHLVDVPSSTYLLSLAPQTVTVNVVAAIVSIGVPRIVESNRNRNNNSRQNRPPASLVELVVGDETRSGFSLTIWIDSGGPQQSGTLTLAAILPTLAPHDIILIRHLALNVFGAKVYGSSLRRDQTKIHVLHRGQLSRPEQKDYGPFGDALFSTAHLAAAAHLGAQTVSSSLPTGWQLLEKTARVRDWALQCVLAHPIGGRKSGTGPNDAEGKKLEERDKMAPTWMLPPADTQ
ncbi:hypothetical protein SEPCBS57363_005723 [Sporothrix epigloea]|uniref:Uncharacterized protein n=1 Tax=Sporothrix epigloea TaxID=1892477 RepID=A0ABP0DZ51_9PEZI